MLKILIVDDEKLIREGLVNYIDWTSLDIEVIGTASNGKSALELILKMKPDIILSDIQMSTMNGIELIKALRENNIKSEVIFISAYSNFEYAKNAIKYGAFDYVLKPIEEEVLIQVLKKCIYKISENKSQNLLTINEAIKNEEYWRQLIIDLINGKSKLSKVEENLLNSYENNFIMLSIIRFDTEQNRDEYIKIFYDMLDNIVSENLINKIILISINVNEIVLIFIWENTDTVNLYNVIKKICLETFMIIKYEKQILCSVSLSGINKSLINIKRNYTEASVALLCESLDIKGKLKEFIMLKKHAMNNKHIDLGKSKLLNYINDGNRDGIDEFLKDTLLNYVSNDTIYDINVVKIELIEMVDYISDVIDGYIIESKFKQRIFNINNVANMYNGIKNELFKMTEYLNALPERTGNMQVNLALNYIHNNYYKNISLNKIAESLYISPSYLSKIFGEKVKEGFSKYLIRYRIKIAKELLKSPKYKIYNISEMVGYSDVSHFTKIFKQIEGITPTKYRNYIKQ